MAVNDGRIVVLRALPGLGDLLCVVPALRAVRAAHPAAEITFIGLPATEWFAARFSPFIDRFVPLTAWPGLPEAPGPAEEAVRFVARERRRGYDLALQLHGDGRISNGLVMQLGARRVAGLRCPDQPSPGPTFVTTPDAASEVERTLLPLQACGIPAVDRSLEFPEHERDRQEELVLGPPGEPSTSSFTSMPAGSAIAATMAAATAAGSARTASGPGRY